jgi:hypothetical protein
VDATGCPLPVPADFDGDSDIDQEDFGLLQRCMTGPSVPITAPECQKANLDHDLDIDQSDTGKFLHCYTGPGLVGTHTARIRALRD